jgi:hypothetical protein
MKKFLIIFSIVFAIIIAEIIANLAKIRPLLWKSSFYSFLNVGWYTWHGADHLYENEIHKEQTNGFLTRGAKPDKKIKKNIILLGDSVIETSHRLNEMPENYLRNYLNKTNVISFASWGWATDQQYIHLKKYINKIKPDHVILWFSVNDLMGNKHKQGFLGLKPTFGLKKDKNNNYYLSGPNKLPGKNYFEYSYFYRVINKLVGRYKLKNYKSYFDYLESCENNNSSDYVNKDELLNNFYNIKMYERRKLVNTHFEKPYGRKPADINTYPSFEEWKKNYYSNFLNLILEDSQVLSVEYLEDPLKGNRLIISDEEREKEILTNKLLLKVQDLTNEHQASFHIIFPFLPEHYKPFNDNKVYRYCFNNREFVYSNEAFDQKLNRIFTNINNVFIANLGDFRLRNHDLFDGHLSREANKYVMKKLSEYIREFDN